MNEGTFTEHVNLHAAMARMAVAPGGCCQDDMERCNCACHSQLSEGDTVHHVAPCCGTAPCGKGRIQINALEIHKQHCTQCLLVAAAEKDKNLLVEAAEKDKKQIHRVRMDSFSLTIKPPFGGFILLTQRYTFFDRIDGDIVSISGK